MNPRDNLTDAERSRQGKAELYRLPADLIDAEGRRCRFWFRDYVDRGEFLNLFNTLHHKYGHQTRAEIPLDEENVSL